jgi:hypothetical protein
MKVDGGLPSLAAEPVWWNVDGSEFSSVLRSRVEMGADGYSSSKGFGVKAES